MTLLDECLGLWRDQTEGQLARLYMSHDTACMLDIEEGRPTIHVCGSKVWSRQGHHAAFWGDMPVQIEECDMPFGLILGGYEPGTNWSFTPFTSTWTGTSNTWTAWTTNATTSSTPPPTVAATGPFTLKSGKTAPFDYKIDLTLSNKASGQTFDVASSMKKLRGKVGKK